MSRVGHGHGKSRDLEQKAKTYEDVAGSEEVKLQVSSPHDGLLLGLLAQRHPGWKKQRRCPCTRTCLRPLPGEEGAARDQDVGAPSPAPAHRHAAHHVGLVAVAVGLADGGLVEAEADGRQDRRGAGFLDGQKKSPDSVEMKKLPTRKTEVGGQL